MMITRNGAGTNESVVEQVNVKTGLVTRTSRNILRYFGYLARGRETMKLLIVHGNVFCRRQQVKLLRQFKNDKRIHLPRNMSSIPRIDGMSRSNTP